MIIDFETSYLGKEYYVEATIHRQHYVFGSDCDGNRGEPRCEYELSYFELFDSEMKKLKHDEVSDELYTFVEEEIEKQIQKGNFDD